jgi:beta-lactamase regulating signal transducer with metallopeptidase domain
MLLATFSAVSIGCGVIRAWRAWAAAATLLGECGPPDERVLISGRNVDVIDLPHGIVAVVGVCRPRIIAATGVLAVCSVEEVGEIIGHEAAHISAHDNLKLLLLIASPDMLAWTPAGKSLSARWRAAVEFEADATAAGADPWKRVTLASGLIKIARLTRTKRPLAELSMPIAADDVEGRVRRLLAPLPPPGGKVPMKAIVVVGVLTAIAAVPLYGIVQELIEALVACGR